MTARSCFKCGHDGRGPNGLRPYGPGGKDVCARCCLGDPELEAEARRQLAARLLNHSGPLILVDDEQVGPRPMKKGGDA